MTLSGETVENCTAWQTKEVARIEALSEQEVLSELESIMKECAYSWHSINELLQAKVDNNELEPSSVDGDILFEWNNLCDEKRKWERKGCLSTTRADFNRDCLINLKILPFQAGLGLENLKLVTANVDKSNLSTKDLWVGADKLVYHSSSDSRGDGDDGDDDDDCLSWIVDDENEYENSDAGYESSDYFEFGDGTSGLEA